MIRITCGLLLCLLMLPLKAAESVFMEVHLLDRQGEPTDSLTVKVGQRVTMAVDIYTDTWFTRAPDIQPLELKGAINLQVQQFGTNYSDNRQGVSYAVQRREVTLFPQRPGQFIVPGQRASVWAAGEGGKRLPPVDVRSEPLVFQVEAITTEIETGSPAVLVADDLELKDTFEPDLQALQSGARNLYAGDAVIRRVRLKAQGTLGMLIKPLPWPALNDVTQQGRRAQVNDRTNRGEFTGIREEIRSYVFERAGDYVLPELTVYWWDATNESIESVTLPERRLTVQAGGALQSGSDASMTVGVKARWQWSTVLKLLCLSIAAVLCGWWLVIRAYPDLRARWQRRREAYLASRRYARRQLLAACRQGERDEIMRCFYRWRQLLANLDQQSPAMMALQQSVIDFYQVYYTLTVEQQKQRLAQLLVNIHAVAQQYPQARRHARRWGLPRGKTLVDLNPSP